ncbi:MAG: hypothetical protein AVDCRST_MAG87-282, partial [uncultured Thermomicrobiales bacterium]
GGRENMRRSSRRAPVPPSGLALAYEGNPRRPERKYRLRRRGDV